uniref:leukemia inhibitory factor receptor-like n=1 Tax=Semicossyphus pulcher TaxID=241346 RepID=UPI0037E8028C
MITWLLLLVSLFHESTQDGHVKDSGVLQCGPQNLTLSGSDQMILSTWEDDPSCSALRDVLIYELVVLIDDQQVHHEEVAVTLEQIGSTHSWNWTSHLALECASHSVKISSRYNDQRSPWTQEKTLPGRNPPKEPEVFPRDKLFAVGSRVTFCCILPAGKVFTKLYVTGYNGSNMETTKVNNQTYALTVLLDRPSKFSCTDVKCQTPDYGACAYIDYPPGDRDLQCETRDLESVECHWTVGPKTHLPKHKLSTTYMLVGNDCSDGSKGRCSQKVQVEVGERNWTLTVQNKLGKAELTDRADLMKRVHMLAPEDIVPSTVNARNVTLRWKWGVQRYNNVNITCQMIISHGERNIMSEASGVGLRSALVTNLIPNWTYNVTLRCGTAQHFWKWSDWSTSVNIGTSGDVPDALDVWMQTKDNQTIIVWKEPQANQSHGDISEYEVSWRKTTESGPQNTTKVDYNNHSVDLYLDPTEEYIVTVTARNINGSSAPSTIIIPSLNPDRPGVNSSWIFGSNSSFLLSWSASPAASCGYILDWCPTSGLCDVEWLKVPRNTTNARIISKNFKDGQRYSLSVYACTDGAPVLIGRREGYAKEKRIEDYLFEPLQWKQHELDIEVSWEPVPLRNQTAYIHGYVLYCLDNNNNIVLNVSTDDPEATSLTATNLKISTYTFTVKAKTAAGDCGDTSITATLNSLTDNLIEVVCVSLVTVFGLLSLITILCYRNWSCIKHKVYPPIPKPVLRETWLKQDETRRYPLLVDQNSQREGMDIVAVRELLQKSRAPVNECVIPDYLPYVTVLTQDGNYTPVKSIPQPLSLPTTAAPPEPAAPAPLFRSLLPNPSYSLPMEPGYQQCSSDPGPQEGTRVEPGCDGYQPQAQTESLSTNQEEECPDSPMFCVPTYILLPQALHS